MKTIKKFRNKGAMAPEPSVLRFLNEIPLILTHVFTSERHKREASQWMAFGLLLLNSSWVLDYFLGSY